MADGRIAVDAASLLKGIGVVVKGDRVWITQNFLPTPTRTSPTRPHALLRSSRFQPSAGFRSVALPRVTVPPIVAVHREDLDVYFYQSSADMGEHERVYVEWRFGDQQEPVGYWGVVSTSGTAVFLDDDDVWVFIDDLRSDGSGWLYAAIWGYDSNGGYDWQGEGKLSVDGSRCGTPPGTGSPRPALPSPSRSRPVSRPRSLGHGHAAQRRVPTG